MESIIIPIFGDRVSPRIEYANHFLLVKTKNHSIVSQENISIITDSPLERMQNIIKLKPDLIICNGVSESFKLILVQNSIHVVSWIRGSVNDVLNNYLNREYSKKTGIKEEKLFDSRQT